MSTLVQHGKSKHLMFYLILTCLPLQLFVLWFPKTAAATFYKCSTATLVNSDPKK